MDYGEIQKCSCTLPNGAKALKATVTWIAEILTQNSIDCPLIHCIIHQEAFLRKIFAPNVCTESDNKALNYRILLNF